MAASHLRAVKFGFGGQEGEWKDRLGGGGGGTVSWLNR